MDTIMWTKFFFTDGISNELMDEVKVFFTNGEFWTILLFAKVIEVLDAGGEVEMTVAVGDGVAFVKHILDSRILRL